MSEPLRFPAEFTFGVATSAYQVEGNLENDWSAWERAGKCRDPHARSGKGCGHWERFFDDVELIRATGSTAYRLSIEWARVEPERGRFDEGAWQGYRDRLEALVKAGIRPVVTLHHFTHPAWFHAQTPWHEPSSLQSWQRYVARCAELLEGLGAAVCTINEPNVFLLGGYLAGQMPPGVADGRKLFAAAENLVRAHVLARQALKERLGPQVEVGIASHQMVFAAHRRWHPLDQALTRIAEANFNGAILEALTTGVLAMQAPGFTAGSVRIEGAERSMDFVGVNYYTRSHLRFIPRAPWLEFGFRDEYKKGLTDIGWEDYPSGFRAVLRQMKKYGLPVWITENGIDDRAGTRRPSFMYEHLRELLLARADGVNITTYLHWSLMDNFEWLEAWGPRFGLYRVDFETQARVATPAVAYYRGLTETRVLAPPG